MGGGPIFGACVWSKNKELMHARIKRKAVWTYLYIYLAGHANLACNIWFQFEARNIDRSI